MINQIIQEIEKHKDECIQDLMTLIQLESSDGKSTKAQVFVEKYLKDLGFETNTFSDLDEGVYKLEDYCPYDFEYAEDAYNVVGISKGQADHPSLLLFGHIDTEAEDYFGKKEDPYKAYIKDEKIYGLGASDDKGGIMMMLCALKYVTQFLKLPYTCTVMSILGKHGGAKGTLSALLKGYRGDYGIYLHPAETGAGFAEIKNISLGVIDYDLYVYGENGKAHDDLDPGINSNIIASKVIQKLEDFNQRYRNTYRFDFGSFKDEPSFILNIGSVESNAGYGGISTCTKIKVRIRFFEPLSLKAVDEVLKEELKVFKDIKIVQGNFRANPALVKTEEPFIQMIKKSITKELGIHDFIHQYHGGSDIRLPILYGDCKCIGMGPSCQLPLANSQQDEWISIDDYINGIKILASILVDFIDFT